MARKSNSRAARWADAVGEARSALDELQKHIDDLASAMADLKGVQEEYQDWLDNLPDSLRDSPVGTKLQEVTEIDLDVEIDLGEVEGVIDSAEGADLPLGWGKD